MTWTIITTQILWAIFIIFWLISALKAKRNKSGVFRKWAPVRISMIILLVVIFSYEPIRNLVSYRFPSSTLETIGVLLVATGIGIAIWARIYLGTNWGMPMSVKENPDLITSGPYKYVRHPIYTGVILAMFGSGFVLVGWWISLILFGAYFVFSAKKEEKLMLKIFPDKYPEYKNNTYMLIPFIF